MRHNTQYSASLHSPQDPIFGEQWETLCQQHTPVLLIDLKAIMVTHHASPHRLNRMKPLLAQERINCRTHGLAEERGERGEQQRGVCGRALAQAAEVNSELDERELLASDC